MVLRLYHAREISPRDLPEVLHMLAALAERAGLARRPRLYYVPSAMLNAFAVGGRDDAVIAVTDGMLRALNLRELMGVLAHEISHIRNRDLWLMGIADLAGRLTRLMTLLGLALLMINLPLWLSGAAAIPWLVIPLLVFAPQITLLLQLALSRAREFDADLDAAGLSGDPVGLASALAKLERYQRGAWEQILMPGQRLPEPSVLRTHPPTAERIARLEALSGAPPLTPLPERGAARTIETAWPMVHGAPHGRLFGFWY
jgi:heat shock protein HtpX